MLWKQQSNYSYRHTCPRSMAKNSFTIFAGQWIIFDTPINASAVNIGKKVKAVIEKKLSNIVSSKIDR